MTIDEIRLKLGFQPFDEFALERYRWLCSDQRVRDLGLERVVESLRDGRSTGKTTKMLCAALEEASRGNTVRIVGHTVAFSRELTIRAQESARDLGIDPEMVRPSVDEPVAVVFNDQYRD